MWRLPLMLAVDAALCFVPFCILLSWLGYGKD
jgi:hypothetical protein